jgi:hypothetical protein
LLTDVDKFTAEGEFLKVRNRQWAIGNGQKTKPKTQKIIIENTGKITSHLNNSLVIKRLPIVNCLLLIGY